MTVAQIKERIAKAEDKLAKKQNTIVKKNAQLLKKKNALVKLDVDTEKVFSDRFAIREYEKDGMWDDIYWTFCDCTHLIEDIERLTKELPEIEALIAKYNTQLVEAKKKGDIMEEMPEIMKQAKEELITQWDIFDKQQKARLLKEYAEMEAEDTRETKWNDRAYARFIRKHSYKAYEDMHKTEAEIHKDNVRSANEYILDLYNRVIARVGEIKAVDQLFCAGPALNGYISGTLGTVEVRTILAGGYNIQRLHCRTLVYNA